MSAINSELESQLQEREAGVADLVAAYEAAEVPYFAAVTATTPAVQQFVASNSSKWAPMPTWDDQLRELEALS